MVHTTMEKTSISLLELQKITGYLAFASTVVPLGRTFLRRLYNMQLYFPPGSGYHRWHISNEACKDLAWWAEVLSQAPQRSIALQNREIICTWSDAASTKGLGAYYTCPSQPYPQPNSVLSIALPTPPGMQENTLTYKKCKRLSRFCSIGGGYGRVKGLLCIPTTVQYPTA